MSTVRVGRQLPGGEGSVAEAVCLCLMDASVGSQRNTLRTVTFFVERYLIIPQSVTAVLVL